MTYEKNHSLIYTLNKCAAACNYCAMACLEEEEVQLLRDCIKTNLDCADICHVTATLLSRGSAFSASLLEECAVLCNACAATCKKHAHMEHCRVCAETCFACGEECAAYATETA